MATKKPAKKSAVKSSAARKTTKKAVAKKVVAKVDTAAVYAAPASNKKLTFSEKLATIRPGELIAEFLGVFAIAASALVFANTGFQYMLAIVAVVVIFGVISGAFLNPAVAFAAWINRKLNLPKLVALIIAQGLGALLAFFVIGAFIDEQNAIYAEDGARTVATVETKLADQGYTAEVVEQQFGSYEAFYEQYGGKNTIASQVGIKVKYEAEAIGKHKELFVFFAELVGSIIVGLGAGYAFLASRKSLVRGFAYGGAIFIGLSIAGGVAILNPAVAGALGAYPLSGWFSDAVWPYVIFMLATTIGVTVGFSLYNVILKDSGCGCGNPSCDCKK